MPHNEVKLTTETTVKTFAEVIVNGESKGKREINGGPSVLHLAKELATEYGVRSFNVTYTPPDGSPTPITSEAHGNDTPVAHGSTVAVQAKDSRGSKQKMSGHSADASDTQPPEQASTTAPTSAVGEPNDNLGNTTESATTASEAAKDEGSDEKVADPATTTE